MDGKIIAVAIAPRGLGLRYWVFRHSGLEVGERFERVCSPSVHGAHGVVVSHPLSMREALGSIPSVSIFFFVLILCLMAAFVLV